VPEGPQLVEYQPVTGIGVYPWGPWKPLNRSHLRGWAKRNNRYIVQAPGYQALIQHGARAICMPTLGLQPIDTQWPARESAWKNPRIYPPMFISQNNLCEMVMFANPVIKRLRGRLSSLYLCRSAAMTRRACIYQPRQASAEPAFMRVRKPPIRSYNSDHI
jgi:hypothetical protein